MDISSARDFINCYNAENRYKRKMKERFRAFCYEDLVKRDKASLDIFWLKDESLETAREQFRGIEDELKD